MINSSSYVKFFVDDRCVAVIYFVDRSFFLHFVHHLDDRMKEFGAVNFEICNFEEDFEA